MTFRFPAAKKILTFFKNLVQKDGYIKLFELLQIYQKEEYSFLERSILESHECGHRISGGFPPIREFELYTKH